VRGEEGLNFSDEFLRDLHRDFVAVDLEFEALAEELGYPFGAEALCDGGLIGDGCVTRGEGDEDIFVWLEADGLHAGRDIVLTIAVLDLKLVRHRAQFAFLELMVAIDGFQLARFCDDVAGEFGGIACRVWKDWIDDSGFFSLAGNAAKVVFFDSCRSRRECGRRGRFGFGCGFHNSFDNISSAAVAYCASCFALACRAFQVFVSASNPESQDIPDL
jgi:hypothetical protein